MKSFVCKQTEATSKTPINYDVIIHSRRLFFFCFCSLHNGKTENLFWVFPFEKRMSFEIIWLLLLHQYLLKRTWNCYKVGKIGEILIILFHWGEWIICQVKTFIPLFIASLNTYFRLKEVVDFRCEYFYKEKQNEFILIWFRI